MCFIVLFFQPALGLIHHAQFKKYQTRTVWSHAHIWVGRLVITLGIINGGLGFQLAESMGMEVKDRMIAYSVIAGVTWVAWVAATAIGERRRKRASMDDSRKYSGSESSGVVETQRADIPHPGHGHFAPKNEATVSPL